MIVILKSTRKDEGDVVTTKHALYVCKVLPVNSLQHIPPSCALEDPVDVLIDSALNQGGDDPLSLDWRR